MDDPLDIVVCPGCGERMERDNSGCPDCGYVWDDGPVLTLRAMLDAPNYSEPEALCINEVSSGFLRAFAEAVRKEVGND